jgi:hypothetical protein
LVEERGALETDFPVLGIGVDFVWLRSHLIVLIEIVGAKRGSLQTLGAGRRDGELRVRLGVFNRAPGNDILRETGLISGS